MSEYLKIPKSKRATGLRVKCPVCNALVNDYSRANTGNPGKICKIHGDKQYFVVYAYPRGSVKPRVIRLETRIYDQAKDEAAKIRKEIKENSYKPSPRDIYTLMNIPYDLQEIIEIAEKLRDYTVDVVTCNSCCNKIIETINKIRISVQNNEITQAENTTTANTNGVKKIGDFEIDTNPSTLFPLLLEEYFRVKKEYLGENGIKQFDKLSQTLNDFKDFLIFHKVDIEEFSILDIHTTIVEKFYERISTTPNSRGKIPANATINSWVGDLIAFENWILRKKKIQMHPVFHTLKRRRVIKRKLIISYSNYCKILDYSDKKIEITKSKTVSLFKPWTTLGIRLGVQLGGRLEEISSLKFSDIKELEGKYYLKFEDLKNNRIKRYEKKEEKIIKCVPISIGLIKLLNELDWYKYKGTDRYVLAPEINEDRFRVIKNCLPLCFREAYASLELEEKISFKNLRKTFTTALEIYQNNKVRIHREVGTAKDHYWNDDKLAAELYEWSIFPEEEITK